MFYFCCSIKTPTHWDIVTIEIIGDLNQMSFSVKEYLFDLNKKDDFIHGLLRLNNKKFRISSISFSCFSFWLRFSEAQFVGPNENGFIFL